MQEMYSFENEEIVKNSKKYKLSAEAEAIVKEYREKAEAVNRPFTSFVANNNLYVLKWLDWTDELSPLFSPVWNLKEDRKYTIVDLSLEETAPYEVFEMQKLINSIKL